MYTIQEYCRPDTLAEAYGLLTDNRRNQLLGGSTFLRITSLKIKCAIDLDSLSLDYLYQDRGGTLHIGAMCPLRTVETSPLITNYARGVLAHAVREIVGVQFRRAATVGATVFTRYGFSDFITPLLACGAKVALFHQGILDLSEFLTQPRTRDILTEIILPPCSGHACFLSMRNSHSDLAILNAAVCHSSEGVCISVGARPGVAALAHSAGRYTQAHWGEPPEAWVSEAARRAVEELSFQTNMRGSAGYRRALCSTLISRLLLSLTGREEVLA